MAGDTHVQFDPSSSLDDGERRERYLTAKYGAHQMQLIRKRIAVEQWLIDELQKLSHDSDSTEIDVDELLDVEDTEERRRYLRKKLEPLYHSSPDLINKFISELLEKAKQL